MTKAIFLMMPLLFAWNTAGAVFAADMLPQSLRGVWALEPSDCSDDGAADFRIEVTANEVVFAASVWAARRWKQSGGGWLGLASVEEEGYAGQVPGLRSITLQLTSGKTLKISRQGEPATVYHRCSSSKAS